MGKQWDGSVEEEYIQDYKPVSVVGILAFILGLISVFSVYVPEVWVVGLLAVILSFVAIVRASSQPATLSWLAYIAAFLAVISVTWSQASRSSYEANLLHTASQHGENWIKMIAEGDVNEAICLRMQYQDRPLDGTDLDAFFKMTDRPDSTMSMMPAPAEMKKIFTESTAVKNVIASGEKTRIHPKPEMNLITKTSQGIAEISVFYDLDLILDGKPVTHEFVVHMFRSKLASGVQWQIERMEDNSASSTHVPQMLDGMSAD